MAIYLYKYLYKYIEIIFQDNVFIVSVIAVFYKKIAVDIEK